jgi:formiminotetrahydrofolate cyclodeaminase
MAHKDKRVGVFLEELAAAPATPGSGSAAALAGAMGAALVGMVCRLTIGRKRFADVEDELRAVLEQAETLRVRLTELANADSEAFDQVMTAYHLPKETEEEGAARQAAVQAALQGATLVPLETASACATVVELAAQVIEKINPNALGDAGAAALLAEAGLKSAQLNVAINLTDIHNPEFVRETQEGLRGILAGAGEAKERVFAYVLDQVK